MPNDKKKTNPASMHDALVSSSTDDLLLAAQARGDESLETGRYIITYRQDAAAEGIKSLKSRGLRVADARDFKDQAVNIQDVGDAEVLSFPEIGAALVSGAALRASGLSTEAAVADQGAVETIEPEYFAFALKGGEYLRGFAKAANTIAAEFGKEGAVVDEEDEVDAAVLGATWGLVRCKVPSSSRSGLGIRVAVLDTGLDLRHPDFAGRPIVAQSFVGQPVQDLNGHGTHCTGTASGTKTPPGTTPRYGIAFGDRIFIGKVLTNLGSGSTATVLAGMNWAIANRCEVISMSLGSNSPVQAAYTAAGAAALARGCLIVAAAGNRTGAPTGAPANSPTIMSVASLDPSLAPSVFSSVGKVEIAAPGRDVFSTWPMPRRYNIISGTSMATPHVAGCAALWAQTSPALRGMALWRRLQTSARPLPFPPSRVGAGLVQAPL